MIETAGEINRQDVHQAFRNISVPLTSEDVAEEGASLCRVYGLSPSQLALKWEALAMQNQNSLPSPTLECLEKLKRELQRQFQKKEQKRHDPTIYNKNTIHKFEQMEVTPSRLPSSSASRITTPSTATSFAVTPEVKRSVSSRLDAYGLPNVASSPHHSSPYSSSSNPSPHTVKYREQRLTGRIESTLHPHLPDTLSARPSTASPCTLEFHDTIEPYKYMFEKIAHKANALDDHLVAFTKEIVEQQGAAVLPLSHPAVPRQEPLFTVGRICCDSEGKLNEKSVLLESSRDLGSGHKVRLNLQELPVYALFPGQIVGVQGMNPHGHEIIAQKLILGAPRPKRPSPITTTSSSSFQMVMASGPFTLDDSLQYELLDDLLAHCQHADLLVLTGPFVDAEHPLLSQSPLSPLELFQTQILAKFDRLGSHCQILLVPSVRDLIGDHVVYPQPAWTLPAALRRPNLAVGSNPAHVTINGFFSVTVSSQDILLPLSSEEISRGDTQDRLSRLCQHLVAQHSVYPLYPCAPGSLMAVSRLAASQLATTPDLLMVPSDLRAFAKTAMAGATVCVNPGRLAKRQTGGTFARLTVDASLPIDSDRIRVDLLRI